MTASTENILAYEAADFVEAHALAAHLEAAGVEVRVTGDALQGAYGSVGTSSLGDAEVWIAAADRETAEPLIAAWQAEHRAGGVPGERLSKFSTSTVTLAIALVVAAVVAGTFLLEREQGDVAFAVVELVGGISVVIAVIVALARRSRR